MVLLALEDSYTILSLGRSEMSHFGFLAGFCCRGVLFGGRNSV